MARNALYAAIDIGTTKVCTLVGRPGPGDSLEITGVGIVPSRGLIKGMVVDMEEAVEAIRASVQRAERSSGSRIFSAHVGITGNHVSSMNNKGMVTITRNDRLVSEEDVNRVLEAARSSVGVPNNREIIHVVPRSYTLDEQEGVRNPIGLHGFRLDVEAHIITGAINSIQNLAKCVQTAGVQVDNLVLEPLASGEAVLQEDERETGTILVDIGGGTTDLAVFTQGSVGYTTVIPVGGYQFTQDLVIGLRTPYAAAEAAKITYGSVEPAAIHVDEMADLTAFGTAGTRPVSRRLMADILRARFEDLLTLIQASVRQSGYDGLLPAGITFTGGSSNLPNIVSLTEEFLAVPARVGKPENITGLSDALEDPAYATSIGLLLWAIRYGDEDGSSQTDERSFALRDFFQNLFSWLGPRR